MYIDKELYQQAYAQYERWNKIEYAERIRNAGKLTHDEAWRRYTDLMALTYKMPNKPSEWQREEKLAALDRYYDGVRQLEAWRQKRGKET